MTSIWIEAAKVLVDLVRAAAWPLVVVFLAWKLKPDLPGILSSLFRRKLEVEVPGLKATVHEAEAAEQLQAAADNPATEKLSEPTLLDPSSRVAVNLIENNLRDILKAVDQEKREAVLLRSLAETRLVSSHEFSYNRAFGSQIVFLRKLNEVQRITIDQAHDFWKPYLVQFPDLYNTYTFEAWLGFMITNGLVVRNGNDLAISDFGRDFLFYILEQRLRENKPW